MISAVTGNKELFEKWGGRIAGIVHDSDGIRWGLHDYLVEEYYSIPWLEEELDWYVSTYGRTCKLTNKCG